ncbi:MAG: carbohydrate ABC transporter permease [Candidatus Rokubacteria bacterium]|nr:carbohydrate ABC transporter permease [Candidatus Rokubacteria bacterium]
MRLHPLAHAAVLGTLCAFTAFGLFPIVWIVLTSLKPPIDTFAVPPVFLFRPTIESYAQLFGGGRQLSELGLFLRNSLVIAGLSTVWTVVAASLSAYSLARLRFRGRGLLGFLIIATRMLPPIATAIPTFLLLNRLGLLDTHLGLIAVYSAINIPFAVWMLRGYMDDIPIELEEAAAIDGCTRLASLARIVLPLVAPGLAATTVYTFLLAWNEFALALFLTARHAATMPIFILNFVTDDGVQWGPMSAAATVMMALPVLFVLVARRYVVRGLLTGALKG